MRLRCLVPCTALLYLATTLTACESTGSLAIGELMRAAGLEIGGGLDDGTIGAGLKEALRVGTDRAVASTSRRDGYFGNALIRIPIPEELQTVARGLRAVGLGQQVDELELGMNRAAERAAAEATPVFVDAITQMTFADVRAIWSGGNRAATDYLRAKTSETLRARFAPLVEDAMNAVGLVQLYDRVVASTEALPFVSAPRLDLRAHVTDRALAGLFTVLGQEEERIRRDPAARTSELLRRVFGESDG